MLSSSEVVDLYKKHGLKARPYFYDIRNNETCLIGLLHFDKTGESPTCMHDARTALGLNNFELEDIMSGFDGSWRGPRRCDNDLMQYGHNVGRACIEAGIYNNLVS